MQSISDSSFFVNTPYQTAVNTYPTNYFFEPMVDPLAAEIRSMQAAEARRESGVLSDTAMAFSSVVSGNIIQAQNLADDFLNLMFEGGAFSQWRYRIFSKYLSDGD